MHTAEVRSPRLPFSLYTNPVLPLPTDTQYENGFSCPKNMSPVELSACRDRQFPYFPRRTIGYHRTLSKKPRTQARENKAHIGWSRNAHHLSKAERTIVDISDKIPGIMRTSLQMESLHRSISRTASILPRPKTKRSWNSRI